MPELFSAPAGSESDANAESGRDRLLKALRTPYSRSQLSAAVLLGVLGFAAVVQVQATDEDDQYVGASQQDLIQLINSQALAQERVEDQISSLEDARDALLSDTQSSQTALDLARSRVAALGILTGVRPAVGPGVEVTVDGPPLSVGTQQLVTGIQELRSAGAEAMQINKTVRIVGSSAISDGPGDSVIIDSQQVSAPFVIEAIGDPTALDKAIFFPEGFADDVEAADGRVTVRRLDRVEINTTRAVSPPQYAQPVPEG